MVILAISASVSMACRIGGSQGRDGSRVPASHLQGRPRLPERIPLMRRSLLAALFVTVIAGCAAPTPYAGTHSNPDPHEHSDPNADPHSHAYADADRCPHTYSHRYSDGDPHCHADRDSHTHTNRNGNSHAEADGHSPPLLRRRNLPRHLPLSRPPLPYPRRCCSPTRESGIACLTPRAAGCSSQERCGSPRLWAPTRYWVDAALPARTQDVIRTTVMPALETWTHHAWTESEEQTEALQWYEGRCLLWHVVRRQGRLGGMCGIGRKHHWLTAVCLRARKASRSSSQRG